MPHVLVGIAATFSGAQMSVDTPCWVAPSTSITVNGRYMTAAPTALDYSTNGGSTWTAATSPVISGGSFSFAISAGLAAGTYTVAVRDHNNTYRSGVSGTLHVNTWLPSALSGLVACFDPNDFTNTPDNGAHAVTNMYHIYSNTKFLTQPTTVNRPWIARSSGADGHHRILKCQTCYTITGADTNASFMTAGGISGFSALVGLTNTTNSTTGSWSAFCAGYIDRTVPFQNYFLWAQGATPGPFQYNQLRINGTANISANVNASSGSGVGATYATLVTGWHTMGIVKNGSSVTLYLDGASVATATMTNTASFSASSSSGNFVLGGILPAGSSTFSGAPSPGYGGSIFTNNALTGSDLTNAQAWCSASVGLS